MHSRRKKISHLVSGNCYTFLSSILQSSFLDHKNECHVVDSIEEVIESEMKVHLDNVNQLSDDDVCVFVDVQSTIA